MSPAYRPGLTGTIGVLPGGGWVAEPVPGPPTSTPSEVSPSRALGRHRPDEREAASSRPRGGIGRIDDDGVPENGGDHLVLHDLGDDTPIEGRRIDLAPVLVDDVEPTAGHRGDLRHCRHRCCAHDKPENGDYRKDSITRLRMFVGLEGQRSGRWSDASTLSCIATVGSSKARTVRTSVRPLPVRPPVIARRTCDGARLERRQHERPPHPRAPSMLPVPRPSRPSLACRIPAGAAGTAPADSLAV